MQWKCPSFVKKRMLMALRLQPLPSDGCDAWYIETNATGYPLCIHNTYKTHMSHTQFIQANHITSHHYMLMACTDTSVATSPRHRLLHSRRAACGKSGRPQVLATPKCLGNFSDQDIARSSTIATDNTDLVFVARSSTSRTHHLAWKLFLDPMDSAGSVGRKVRP